MSPAPANVVLQHAGGDPDLPPSPGSAARPGGRVALVLLAAAVGVVGYVVTSRGMLPSPLPMLMLAVLLVTLPTAPALSRRVALNVALVVGWSPLLWWRVWPVDVDHGAAVVALLAAATVLGTLRPGGVRRLVPTTRSSDLLLVAGTGVAALAMAPWEAAGSARRALVLLLPGVDNFAHVGMFATVRALGAVTPALPAPPGGHGWASDDYPQGFHAFAATISQIISAGQTPAAGLPVAYVHAVSLVVVLGTVLLTGAAVSSPRLAGRPLVALPAVGLTWAAFLWAPGQDVLADGFVNFWLAAAAAAAASLLALSSPRRPGPVDTAAVVGLVVMVAWCWAPLVLLAAPALLVLVGPDLRRLGRGVAAGRPPGPDLVVLGILVVGAGCVLRAVVQLMTSVGMSAVVTATGGVHASAPVPALLLDVASVALLARGPTWVRQSRIGSAQMATRLRPLVLVPVTGVVLAGGLLAAQLHTTGTASYYFVKLFVGLELTLAGFVPAVGALVLVELGVSASTRLLGVVAALTATAAATQAFGPVVPARARLGAEGRGGTAAVGAPLDVARIADGVLAAVADQGGVSAAHREYLALGPARAAEAFYPDGWYHALTVSLSDRASAHMDLLHRRVDDLAEATTVVRRLLLRDHSVEVVVDPRDVEPLRRALGSPALAGRVRGWADGVAAADE